MKNSFFSCLLMFSLFFPLPGYAAEPIAAAERSVEMGTQVLAETAAQKLQLVSFDQIKCWFPENIAEILDDETYQEEMRSDYREYSQSMPTFSDSERILNFLSGKHRDFALLRADLDNDGFEDILLEDREFRIHIFSGKDKKLTPLFPDRLQKQKDEAPASVSTDLPVEKHDKVPVDMSFASGTLSLYFAPETDFVGEYRLADGVLVDVSDPHGP